MRATVGLISVASGLACAGAPGERVTEQVLGDAAYSLGRGSGWAPPAVPDPAAYRVAPDRGLVAVAVRAQDDDPAQAAALVGATMERLTAALPAGCTLRATDYAPPIDGVATLSATLDVAFPDPAFPARIDHLDACLAALRVDPQGVQLAVGAPVWTVDHPEAHFAALAERLTRAQTAAASIIAPGVHPGDRRCVPSGEVLVGERRLDGVELRLDVTCAVAPPAPVAD